jgi:hypothetical protein
VSAHMGLKVTDDGGQASVRVAFADKQHEL